MFCCWCLFVKDLVTLLFKGGREIKISIAIHLSPLCTCTSSYVKKLFFLCWNTIFCYYAINRLIPKFIILGIKLICLKTINTW